MKKLTVASVFILILAIALIIFIRSSNDHLECSNILETSYAEIDGKKTETTTTKHICKEKYNF